MKQKLITLAFSAMACFLFSCQKDVSLTGEEVKDAQSEIISIAASEPCGTPLTKTLLDEGGVLTLGQMVVSNDANNITITLTSSITNNFLYRVKVIYGSEAHVAAALFSSSWYTACDGPAQVDYVKNIAPGKMTDTVQISNSNFQADGCISLAVFVTFIDAVSGAGSCGFPYPVGTQYGSVAHQSTFTYCKQACPPPPPGDCGQLRTQTPGGWGAPPNGNNPGAYLRDNFDAAFGDFITVGCYPDNYYIKLTSAQAIETLLPTGGKAQALTANATDPASIKNVLVGHLVALTLSAGFDTYDANFGQAGITLGAMKIGSGPFAGWTVNQFLAEANKILGGCSSSYSINSVLETATNINENYVDGKIDNGFLVCPAPTPR